MESTTEKLLSRIKW